MASDKVKVILEWPEAHKVWDIPSFLGFCNFYQCFIDNYSGITTLLTRLTWKGAPWIFDNKCCSAFETLKEAFTQVPVLHHWLPDHQLVVETDTSDYALTAILSIIINDKLHPVAFLSRTFTSTKLNYDIHNKELLAIFEAFKTWRHYLEGSALLVNVVTDHKNLVYFSTTKILT